MNARSLDRRSVANPPHSSRWAPRIILTLLLVVTVCSPASAATEEPIADPEWLDEELAAIDELIEQDRLEEAEVWAGELLEEVESVWGFRSRQSAMVLRDVVYSRLMLGKPADEEMQRQAQRMVEILESTLGADAPMVAVALTDAGIVYRRAGLFDQAVTMFERAIEIHSHWSIEDPRLALLKTHLADALFDIGDFDRGGALYQSVLDYYESRSLADDMTIARALVNVSRVKIKTGDIEGARPLVQRALAVFENSSAPADTELASDLGNLANSLKDAGDPDDARALYEYALEMHELILGPEHEKAVVITNLGILDLQTGNLEMARTRLEKGLGILEKTRGPSHPDAAVALSALGWVAYLERENERALELVRRSIEIRETEWNPEHPDLAKDFYLLGSCHEELGQFESAIEVYSRALAINEKAFGTKHPIFADNLLILGLTLLRADQTDLAETHLESALSILANEDAPRGIYVGEAWFGLAVVEARRGNRVEATRNLEEAGHARATIPGEGNATMTFDRARFHALIGESAEAIRLLREAIVKGYSNPRLDRLPDLRSLHGNPEFDAIIADSDL